MWCRWHCPLADSNTWLIESSTREALDALHASCKQRELPTSMGFCCALLAQVCFLSKMEPVAGPTGGPETASMHPSTLECLLLPAGGAALRAVRL
jgi:hypothetical protein